MNSVNRLWLVNNYMQNCTLKLCNKMVEDTIRQFKLNWRNLLQGRTSGNFQEFTILISYGQVMNASDKDRVIVKVCRP
jgi:hypothetical protein